MIEKHDDYMKFRLHTSLKNRLVKHCAKSKEKYSKVIRKAIVKYLDEEEKK